MKKTINYLIDNGADILFIGSMVVVGIFLIAFMIGFGA